MRPRQAPEVRKLLIKQAVKKYMQTPIGKAKKAFSESKRRALKLNATPKWLSEYDLKTIKMYYMLAREWSDAYGVPLEIDHIEPLKGKDVCGLHVPWNLQITSEIANQTKGNRRE